MSWPFEKEKNPTNPEVKPAETDAAKPKEKSPAELISESLQPLMSKFDEFGQRLEKVEQGIPKPRPTEQKPAELASVWEDENAAFNQRLTPVVLRQLEIEARFVKGEVQREYEAQGFGDLWSEYKAQIDQELDNTNLVDSQGKPLRGNPDYIRNCVDMIFGREARKKGIRFDAQKKTFFLETGSAGEGNKNPVSPTDGLTAEQVAAASKWGISAEDYKRAKDNLRVVQ